MDRPRVRVDAAVPRDAAVVPVERDPLTGRAAAFDRDRKGRRQDRRPAEPDSGSPAPVSRPVSPRPPGRVPGGRRTWMVVGAAAVTTAIIVAAVLIVGGRRGGGVDTAAGPSTVPDVPASSAGPSTSATSEASGSEGLPGSSGVMSGSSGLMSSVQTATGPGTPGASTSGGSSAAPAVPAFLDPSRILGYQVSEHLVVDSFQGQATATQGTTRQSRPATCAAGTCTLSLMSTEFSAAAPTITNTVTDTGGPEAFGCWPIVDTLTLTLNPDDGSYAGHYSLVPTSELWRSADGSKSCRAHHREYDLTLTPVVAPDLAGVPEGTPPALDPARIGGYRGSATVAGESSAIAASCARGMCLLSCGACNSAAVMVPAAAEKWVVSGISMSSDCGEGLADLHLTRSGGGSYSGTVTLTYLEKKERPECATPATSVSLALSPTVS